MLSFVESEVDKRGKLYKAVKEKGRIVEMTRQDGSTLQKWVLSMVKKEGRQITQSTVRYFLTKVGEDMENIHGELEKLFCYTLGKQEITIHDIEEICTTHIDNKIFDMVNAVADQKQKQALMYYYDLLALKEPPMRILFLMTRQFRILLEVSEMNRRGYGKKRSVKMSRFRRLRWDAIWHRHRSFLLPVFGRFWRTVLRQKRRSRQEGLPIQWRWSF